MPIVDVQMVVSDSESLVLSASQRQAALAQSLADSMGRCMQSPPGQLWVRLTMLVASAYAENESSLGPSDLPIFVRVLRARWPELAQMTSEAKALAVTVGAVTGRSRERVHIEYAPAGADRVAFGGEFSRSTS